MSIMHLHNEITFLELQEGLKNLDTIDSFSDEELEFLDTILVTKQQLLLSFEGNGKDIARINHRRKIITGVYLGVGKNYV